MDKKIEFYVIRHGETLFNKIKRIQGWADSPLTETGILQARSLGAGLRGIHFDECYSSTSGRAIETADNIIDSAGMDLIVHPKKNFRELFFGDYEGKRVTNEVQDLIDNHFTVGWADHDGESPDMVKTRVFDQFDKIVKSADDNQKIMVVTHGAVLMYIYNSLTGKSIEEYINGSDKTGKTRNKIENCSVTKILYNNGDYELKSIGDLSYRNRGYELIKE